MPIGGANHKKVIGRACPGQISDEGMSGENNENDDQVQ